MNLIKPRKDDCRHLRLDTNESVFFARQLEFIKAQTYDVLYAELSAFRLFPISTDGGPGAKSLTWRSYESIGQAKLVSGYGDDLPRADVRAKEFINPVMSIGASYGWSLQDIRAAMFANVSLEAKKAMAAVRAHNQVINSVAWFGDAESGLPGLKTDSDINTTTALNGGWTTNADDMIEDVNEMITTMISTTKGVEIPNVVAMPPDRLALLNGTPRATTANVSVLGWLKIAWPDIEFTGATELSAWSTTNDAMMAYRRDPMKLSLELPSAYEELPVQQEGLEFIVPTHSRIAGLFVYYPKSIEIRTGIQSGS